MENYKIDSIEDGVAGIEDPSGIMLYISESRLPQGAKEGDLLSLENKVFKILCEETSARKEEISSLLDNIITKKR